MNEIKKKGRKTSKKVSSPESIEQPEANPAEDSGPGDQPRDGEIIVSPRDTIHGPEVYQKARDALDRIDWQRDWSDWLLVAEALSAGRTEAMKKAGTNQPIGRLYNQWFGEVLKREELGTDRLDSTTRSSLFDIAKYRHEIEAWRDKLPLKRRTELNSPNAVLRNWKKANRDPDRAEKKKKKRTQAADLSAANAELSEQLEQLRVRAEQAEQERDQYKREVDPQFGEPVAETLETKIIGLESEIEELKQARDSWVCSKCGAKTKKRKEVAA